MGEQGQSKCANCPADAELMVQWQANDEVCRGQFCQPCAGKLWEMLSPMGRDSFAMDRIAESIETGVSHG